MQQTKNKNGLEIKLLGWKLIMDYLIIYYLEINRVKSKLLLQIACGCPPLICPIYYTTIKIRN